MDDLKTTFPYALEGYGQRWADPVQIRRDLLRASAGRLWQWAAEARAVQGRLANNVAPLDDEAEQQRQEAIRAADSVRLVELEGQLVAAAYAAFGLPPVDPNNGRGVPEAEVAAILKDFLGYAEKKE